ncbi:hypothetical protein TNIN_45961 [Trichonephila inaurata madagascariensis]|uniref:Uncharacterized protein n=1 Tax=Trichonephila inaurata madagascariensis TaxID=2747483 RepID=A0A8X6YKI7_9ARAC|nr:hypothetical protein TNIN_45961 [Trichonephila inaurata madagascariensis]
MWDHEYILPSFLFVPVEKHKTAFDGKVMAIYVALEQVVPRHLYNKVVILSDFKAAIQAVGTGKRLISKNILDYRVLLESLRIEER